MITARSPGWRPTISAAGRSPFASRLLVAITTSGGSPNILRALEVAKQRGIATVGLLGKGGGKAKELVDVPIVVPLATTSDRIQEVHIKVLHIVIEAVERELYPANYAGAR